MSTPTQATYASSWRPGRSSPDQTPGSHASPRHSSISAALHISQKPTTRTSHQEALLAALLASAVAESATQGLQGKLAVEKLSETFDQTGQDLIELNRVTCALSTCDITLGVYPIGQIALAIYFKQHSPTLAGGPDEGAAAAEDFYCDVSSTQKLPSRTGMPNTARRASSSSSTTSLRWSRT